MTRTLADPDLVAAAISREAEGELTASRARVAASADENRRRLQRELHHGAQQRLAHTVLALRLARAALTDGCAPLALIDEALVQAERASSALGDVVRGVLPTILVHGGLRAALESVVADLGLAARVRISTPRLPAATETTAYLVVAETLTDVARHACADNVSVRVDLDGDVLAVEVRAVEVRDDGVGGAGPARGRDLTSLIDRVESAGGTVTVTSPGGAGTVVHALLPVELA